MDWVEAGKSALTALLGLLSGGGLLYYLLEWRPRQRQAAAAADQQEAAAHKTQAEANNIQAEADNRTLDGAYRLIETLTKQMAVLETDQGKSRLELIKLGKRLERAYGRIEYLMGGIRRLNSQIQDTYNGKPVWEATEWEPETDWDDGTQGKRGKTGPL